MSTGCGPLRSEKTALVWVEEFLLASGYRMRRHTHVGPGVVVGLDGAWIGEVGRRDLECSSGDLVVLPEAASHREQSGRTGGRCLLVTLADPGALEPGTRGLFDRDRRIAGAAAASLGWRIAAELARSDALAGEIIDGLAIRIFAGLGRDIEPAIDGGVGNAHGPPAERRWIERVREELDADFRQPLDLGRLAAGAGRSREHVHRRFRRAFGVSPGTYVRARRLEQAARLLVDRDLSLAAVAAECGFTDQSHLTRLFRARFGVTPGRYRALRRPMPG